MPAAHEKKFLHALLLAGLEYDSIQKLRLAFDSFESAWHSGLSKFETAGLDQEVLQKISSAKDRIRPDEEMRKLVAQGVAFITSGDAEFPKELENISSSPLWLYIKGRLEQGKPRLAVVGTRKASAYGREAARKIIRDLADKTDIEIVSGLAQGIDAEAHRASISSGLITAGVIGSGMDRESFFPLENWNLSEEMIEKGGAVISEYPPGSPGLKHHFPARNRIIAGLTAGTLVVEAPEKSGALITAGFALEQGRDVFAIPGQMFSPNAAGVHRLIQDGAKLVTSADDIIEELGLKRKDIKEKAEALLTDDNEKTILGILEEPSSVDDIKEKTKMPTPNIVSCLSMLELKGFIRPMGQNRFQRIM